MDLIDLKNWIVSLFNIKVEKRYPDQAPEDILADLGVNHPDEILCDDEPF